MTSEEIEKWERYYEEAYQRDIARRIYKQCDAEDDAMNYLKDGTPPPVMQSFHAVGHRNALVEGLFTVCAWLITLAMGLALLVIFAVLAGFVCALIGKAFMLAAGWLFR